MAEPFGEATAGSDSTVDADVDVDGLTDDPPPPPSAANSHEDGTSGAARLSEDQKFSVIADHLQRAATIESAVGVQARVDENSIWQHITLAFSVVLLIVIVNYIVAVAMLPQRFPKMFCWQSNVFNDLTSVCAPKIVDGSYQYGAWAVALAATYPPLFSFMELFGVPNLPPQAAQFLVKCIALHGNLITPYMWCGNNAQNCNVTQMTNWSTSKKTSSLYGWYDILAYCPTATVTQSGDNVKCYNDTTQEDEKYFEMRYGWWLTSCGCGNSFAAFFPTGTPRDNLYEQALTIPSIQECVRVKPGAARRTQTALGRLYDGGLVAVAQALALAYHDGDEIYRHMFTGNADFLSRPGEDCTKTGLMTGVTTGVNTFAGAAGLAFMAPGMGLGLLVAGLGVGAGVLTGITSKNYQTEQCQRQHLKSGTAPRKCCTGSGDLCIRKKYPPADEAASFARNVRGKCKIGIPDGAETAVCCFFDVDCHGQDNGCT